MRVLRVCHKSIVLLFFINFCMLIFIFLSKLHNCLMVKHLPAGSVMKTLLVGAFNDPPKSKMQLKRETKVF